MSSIERKCDGIIEDNSDDNKERFPVGTSHYELLVSLDSKMIGVTDYSKVWEELVFKGGTSLGVSDLASEGITEGDMLAPVEGNLECTSHELFERYFDGVKEPIFTWME